MSPSPAENMIKHESRRKLIVRENDIHFSSRSVVFFKVARVLVPFILMKFLELWEVDMSFIEI